MNFKNTGVLIIHVITNLLAFTPQMVADLYKVRWSIELFFRWIKQHLNVKTLFGHKMQSMGNFSVLVLPMFSSICSTIGRNLNDFKPLRCSSLCVVYACPIFQRNGSVLYSIACILSVFSFQKQANQHACLLIYLFCIEEVWY